MMRSQCDWLIDLFIMERRIGAAREVLNRCRLAPRIWWKLRKQVVYALVPKITLVDEAHVLNPEVRDKKVVGTGSSAPVGRYNRRQVGRKRRLKPSIRWRKKTGEDALKIAYIATFRRKADKTTNIMLNQTRQDDQTNQTPIFPSLPSSVCR